MWIKLGIGQYLSCKDYTSYIGLRYSGFTSIPIGNKSDESCYIYKYKFQRVKTRLQFKNMIPIVLFAPWIAISNVGLLFFCEFIFQTECDVDFFYFLLPFMMLFAVLQHR